MGGRWNCGLTLSPLISMSLAKKDAILPSWLHWQESKQRHVDMVPRVGLGVTTCITASKGEGEPGRVWEGNDEGDPAPGDVLFGFIFIFADVVLEGGEFGEDGGRVMFENETRAV